MSVFSKIKESDYTIIIGCGRLGASLANMLSDNGTNVLMLDRDESSFRKLSSSYGGLTLAGDARNIYTLREAGIEDAKVVVSVTNDDNTNIMVAQIAKELYQIPHVVCRLYDPERECVYHEFGINTICPAVLSANEIINLLGSSVYHMEDKAVWKHQYF